MGDGYRGRLILSLFLSAALAGCLTEAGGAQPSVSAEPAASDHVLDAAARPGGDHAVESAGHTEPSKRETPKRAQFPAVADTRKTAAELAPVVTLDAPGDSKVRAQHMVDQAFQRLGAIDRTWLKGDSATVYDQAVALAASGRKALRDGDYTAAEGYARKASTLAADLGEASTQR